MGFAASIVLVVSMSILAYAGRVPAWVAPNDFDKVLHFSMCGALVFFLDRALGGRNAWRGTWAPPLAALLILVPVAIEEYLQRLSPVRSSSIWDFTADAAGAVVMTIFARYGLQHLKPTSAP
jgi:hypothetical protein